MSAKEGTMECWRTQEVHLMTFSSGLMRCTTSGTQWLILKGSTTGTRTTPVGRLKKFATLLDQTLTKDLDKLQDSVVEADGEQGLQRLLFLQREKVSHLTSAFGEEITTKAMLREIHHQRLELAREWEQLRRMMKWGATLVQMTWDLLAGGRA